MTGVAVLDIDQWLAPISDAAPCGNDRHGFDFDPEYIQLSNQFRWQELGDDNPFEGVDWSKTATDCEKLFARCKSLRIITIWLLPLIKKHGFSGLAVGLKLALDMMEQYWDTFEPLLTDEDGDPLPTREFVMKDMAGPLVMKMLDQVEIWDARGLDKVSVQNLLAAVKQKRGDDAAALRSESGESSQQKAASAADPNRMSWETLHVIFQPDITQLNDAQLERFDQQTSVLQQYLHEINQCCEYLNQLKALMRQRDYSQEPFSKLQATLKAIKGALETVKPELTQAPQTRDLTNTDASQAEATAPSDTDSNNPGENQVVLTANRSGAIENRQDVIRSIEKIIEYYRRHEPSSPIPILLNRAKQWVNMDFLALIKDLTPASLKEAEHLLKPTAESLDP